MSNQNKVPKPKQLTMPKIKTEARQAYKMEEFIINDKNEAIKFYPIFPGGRIKQLMEELREDIVYASENNIELVEDDEFFISYIMFLCIKYFTSLEKGISDKLEDKILQYEYLLDTGYYDIIIGEVFMESEKSKVIDAFSKQLGTLRFMEQIEQKTTDYVRTLEFRNQKVFDELNSRLESDENNLEQ